ncbi:hypothetical protein SAMN04488074_1353 [Lentzea albidocapillata subsp. violacea]|uniref:Uncharacterized protein n=1 Tax=Lentzea albidocapillata subsp. violacea TaxID=128104 RepID=A0A1G9YQ42_9PSEU|nr:hypothetical protein SAMN04488074_1353 [Lentzea albidocapillata subsp. violacea]
MAQTVSAGAVDDGVHVRRGKRGREQDMRSAYAAVQMTDDGSGLDCGDGGAVDEICGQFVLIVKRKVLDRVDELGTSDLSEWNRGER